MKSWEVCTWQLGFAWFADADAQSGNFIELDQCIEGNLHGDFASLVWYDKTEFGYGCCLIHAEICK